MNVFDLGLLHPEWDVQIGGAEPSLNESPSDSLAAFPHGISRELYAYLPSNAKTQLQAQEKYLETLVTSTLNRLSSLDEKAVEGGCFYNEATGRDVHLLCKTLSKAKSNLKLRIGQDARQALIQALYTFVTRHSDPTLVFHPKALRTTVNLLDTLLQDEVQAVVNVKTYKAFQERGLVPIVSRPIAPALRLDWRPLYAFTRTILRLDLDRRNHTHYGGQMALTGEVVMSLANWCRHFWKSEDVENLFSTIFPLLSTKPGATLESVLQEQSQLLALLGQITKTDQAVIMAHFLPLSLDEHFLDYQGLLDQLMELWTLVSDSTQWDRAMTSMVSTITRTAPKEQLKWRLDHIKLIFSVSLRQLRLATAGTAFKGPGHPSYSPLVGSLMAAANKPLGKELGVLLVNLLTCELRDDDIHPSSASSSSFSVTSPQARLPPGVEPFLHWLTQIDSYLHPNNSGQAANHLKNIIRGIVSELTDRLKARIIVKDYEKFMSSFGLNFTSTSQGYFDFLGLPALRNGSLEHYLIREEVWDAICPALDRVRIHVSASTLGKDLALLLAHVRPAYLNSSIFPRINFALENPMLDGRLHVPWSIELLSVLAPLLMQTPGSPAILSSLLGLLLDHIDANDTAKSATTFDLALSLVLALAERKKARNAPVSKCLLPAELQTTIVAKYFDELKRSKLGLLYSTKDYVKSDEEAEQLESEISSFEANFSEWIVALFERVLEYVEGIPSGTPPSSSLVRLLEATSAYVNDSIYDLLLRKLSKVVEESPRAKTELNPIIAAFALSRPTATLKACLDGWLVEAKRRSTKKSSGKAIESEVEAVAWKLDILRLICKKSGMSVGSHEKALLAIVEPLLKDENQKIRRAALSVLPAALGPLKPHFQAKAPTQTTSFIDLILDRPTMVEPSKDSLNLISKWAEHFVEPALKVISEASASYSNPPPDAAAATLQPKDLSDALKLIFEFISILGPILPAISPDNTTPSHPATPSVDGSGFEDSEDDTIDETLSFDVLDPSTADSNKIASPDPTTLQASSSTNGAPTKTPKAPLLPKPLSVVTASCLFENLPENLRTLRLRIVETVHGLLTTSIVPGKCTDAKVVRKAFKGLIQALAHNGAKENKWTGAISMVSIAMSSMDGGKQQEKKSSASSDEKSLTVSYPVRYTLSPLHPYYSQWRVNKASSLLRDRWSMARNKLRFGKIESSTIAAFISISGTHPELVRSKKLVRMLMDNVPRFSGSTGFMNAALLSAISKPRPADQPEHAFLAQLTLLLMPTAQGNLVANWKNLERFTTVLQGLHIHDKAMLQVAIAGLYALLLGNLPSSAATPHQDTGFFEAYTRIMDASLKELKTTRPDTHWRYHLFPLGIVCALLRRNIHTPKAHATDATLDSGTAHDGLDGLEILKMLTKTVGDMLPSARVVSRHAITRILTWAQDANDATHSTVIEPLLAESALDTLLAHITIDHSLPPNTPQSVEASLERITAQADPSGSIGDGECGIGSEFVMPRTFNLRHADFWYRLFASLKFSTKSSSEIDATVSSITQYFISRLQVNIISATSTSSSSSTTSTTPKPTLLGTEEKASLLSAASPVSSSSSPVVNAASPVSPSLENVEEVEKHYFALLTAAVGFTRAFPEKAQREIWSVLVSAPRLSVNRISSTIFGIAYLVFYKVDMEIVEKSLVAPFLAPVKGGKDFGTLSPFEVELRLTLLLMIYQESQLRKLDSVAAIVKVLFLEKKAVVSSRPQIRSAALRLLTLLSAYLARTRFVPSVSQHAMSIHNKVIENLIEAVTAEAVEVPLNAAASVSSVATNQTGSAVPVTPEDRIKTSFLTWIAYCISNRVELMLRPEWRAKITSVVVDLSVDSASATAKMASPILLQLSQFVVPPLSILDQVELTKQLENVKQMATSHPRWKARWSLCFFLRFFCFNHAILMNKTENEDIVEWSKHLLEDANLDVRKAATAAISSLVRSSVPSDECLTRFASHFLALISNNNKNVRRKPREGKDDEPSTSPEALNLLQIGTSGLVALCSAVPYEVPSWLPAVIVCLQRLSSHTIGSIAVVATEAVTQFWKTHRDEWAFYKDKFTEDQLRTLEDKPVPSYYA